MALTQLAPPYPIFTDKSGDPLDNGYLYFGEANKNPETNPIQVYYDSAFTQPAAQPLRTSNGYVMRNGSPALIYADSQFSVTIRDKNNALVIYSPVGYGVDPASISGTVVYDDFIGDGSTVIFTLSASPSTKNATNVYIDGVYQSKENYSISGSTLTFSTAPPLNSEIEVVTQESSIIGGASAQQITYNQGGSGSITRTVKSRLQDLVSVKDFGAVGDGVTDDSAAISSAISAVALSGETLIFPTATYLLGTAINIAISSGQSVSIDGLNSTLILADQTSWEQIQIKNSAASNGSTVNVKNLNLIGSGDVYGPHWNEPAGTYPINIGLLIDASNINLENISVEELWGKAINIGYFTNVSIDNVKFRKVGGHSVTYTPDSFGDAIYFNRISGDAIVNITNFDAEGLLNPSGAGTAGGGLSRAGIVFELNAADANTLEVNVSNFQCANFERTFHFEDVCVSSLNVDGAKVENTALMAHLYQPGPTYPALSVYMDNVYYSANASVAFNVNTFFFNSCGGTVRNSTFINPTKAWDGNTANVPGGFNISFEDCDIFWNDARLQGLNCSVTFNDCRMYDYNDDASNATMSVAYQKCAFSTTDAATFGNVLSASAGTETFFSCDFTNQRPSVLKTLQNNRYRTDDGIASGSCIRIDNATTDMPLIPNAVYKVMEVDTGNTLLGYVNSAGAIYAPGGTPAIQAGSTADTVRCGSGVTFSAFVEISQHE